MADSCKMFLGALPPHAQPYPIQFYFSNFGQVLSVNLRMDFDGTRCKGFGNMEMSTPESVENILASGPHYIFGQIIDVKPFLKVTDSAKIFVGGLNSATTPQSLRNYFRTFGTVVEANVKTEPLSGRSRGFGFVAFADAQIVEAVLSAPHKIDGKNVDVKRMDKTGGRANPANSKHPDYYDNKNKLFVGGVSAATTNDSLSAFFSQFGTLLECNVAKDKNTGKNRKFAYLRYDGPESVSNCMAGRPHYVDGAAVETKRSLSNEDAKNLFTVTKLFVGKLTAGHTESTLRDYFSRFGNVVNVMLSRKEDGSGHKGWAFVVFDDYDAVDQVIAQKTHQIEGSYVDCQKGLSRDEMTKLEEQSSRDRVARDQRSGKTYGGGGGLASAAAMGVVTGPLRQSWNNIPDHSAGDPRASGAAWNASGSYPPPPPPGNYAGYGGGGMGPMVATGYDSMGPAAGYGGGASAGYGAPTAGMGQPYYAGGGGAAHDSHGQGAAAHSHQGSAVKGEAFKHILRSSDVSPAGIKALAAEDLLDSSVLMSLTPNQFDTLPITMGDRKRIELAFKTMLTH